MKSSRHKRKAGDRTGLSFEMAVAALQGMLDPTARVTRNERLQDRLGHWREFDVVIRAKAGGHDVLGVIECKDLKRPVGTPEVNAFADKSRNVRANLTLLVSRMGFTKPALELAAHHGIGTFSLLKSDIERHGFVVGVQAHAEIFSWKRVDVLMYFDGEAPSLEPFTVRDIEYRGRPLLHWVVRELHESYPKEAQEGWHTLWLDFRQPELLTVNSTACEVVALAVLAERICERRTKQVQWSGQAFYDWQTKRLRLPHNGHLVTDAFRSDLSDWEPFDGPLPPLGGNFLVEFRPQLFQRVQVRDAELMPPLAEFAEVTLDPPKLDIADGAKRQRHAPESHSTAQSGSHGLAAT